MPRVFDKRYIMSYTRRGAIRGVYYLTQLGLCACAVLAVHHTRNQVNNMSKRMSSAAGELDMDQFDCVSTGQGWRNYKLKASRILSGVVDDSGSSLSDHGPEFIGHAFAVSTGVTGPHNLPTDIESARADPRIWPLVKEALESEI